METLLRALGGLALSLALVGLICYRAAHELRPASMDPPREVSRAVEIERLAELAVYADLRDRLGDEDEEEDEEPPAR